MQIVCMPKHKNISRENLKKFADELHLSGKKIVTTNGCFDILHYGHFAYLKAAKEKGDVLIVGLNSDSSVKKLKGPTRPIHSEEKRLFQLSCLEMVDFVSLFEEDTPIEFLKLVQPHIHVKGGDYEGKEFPEKTFMESIQGEMQFVPFVDGFSTTNILKNLEN